MLAVKRKNENILTWYWTSCQRKNYGKKCANNYQHKATRKCGLKNSKTVANIRCYHQVLRWLRLVTCVEVTNEVDLGWGFTSASSSLSLTGKRDLARAWVQVGRIQSVQLDQRHSTYDVPYSVTSFLDYCAKSKIGSYFVTNFHNTFQWQKFN